MSTWAPSSEHVAELWSEDIRHCVDTFGPNRCMFESNFPVDKQGCSYTVLFNAFQRIADEAGWSGGQASCSLEGRFVLSFDSVEYAGATASVSSFDLAPLGS